MNIPEFTYFKDFSINTQILFLIFFFILALILGFTITQSGVGISPDSIGYISTGENLYHGNGFYTIYDNRNNVSNDYENKVMLSPYTAQPPLYPILIAILMHFGIDSEQSAQLIPILSFAFLMFPIFFIGRILGGNITGYLSCITCLFFTPLLLITSFAWTEMLFILLSALSIFYLIKYNEEFKNINLYIAGIFTSFAILTKYIGIILLFIGLVVIIYKNKDQIKKIMFNTVIFGFLSSFPISLWFYRNIIITSNFSGADRGKSNETLIIIIEKTTHILLNDFNFIFFLFISILLILLFFYSFKNKEFILKYFKKNYIILSYIFSYIVILLSIKSFWAFDPIDSRLLSPIYPFMIMAVFSIFFYCYQIKDLKKWLVLIICVFLILFSSYQINNSTNFTEDSINGVNRDCNSPYWKNNQGIIWIQENMPENATLYSNYAKILEFRLKKPVKNLPLSNNKELIDIFKKEKNAFIICFKKDNCSNQSNKEIIEIKQKHGILTLVADFPDSTIYKTNN